MSGFLILVGILAIIYGIVKAIINMIKKKGTRNPFIIIAAGFVLAIIGGATADSASEALPVEAEKESGEEVAEDEIVDEAEIAEENNENETDKKEYDPKLKITVEEFRENFDKAAEEFDLGFRSNKNAEVEKGEVKDTQKLVTASDFVQVFATLNKDGNMESINLIGSGDGSLDSGMQIIGTIGATIATVQPELTPDERGKILEELKLLSEDEIPQDEQETINGNFKYTLTVSEFVGVMFFVEPAE